MNENDIPEWDRRAFLRRIGLGSVATAFALASVKPALAETIISDSEISGNKLTITPLVDAVDIINFTDKDGNVIFNLDSISNKVKIAALYDSAIDADLNTLSNIDNGDIKAAAAIVESKLTFAATGGHVHDGTADVDGGSKIDIASLKNMNKQSFINLLKNGEFGSWSNGAAAAPDGWTFHQGGSGGGVARIADTKIKTYVARVTKSNAVHSYIEHPLAVPLSYGGRILTIGCWVKSANTVADGVRLYFNDSVNTESSFYQNTGGWEWLTLTRTITATPSYVVVYCLLDYIADSPADFAGFTVVEGSVCPAFSPHPTDQIPIVLTSAPTDAGTNGETRLYAIAGAGGARRMYMSNGTDWKYIAVAT